MCQWRVWSVRIFWMVSVAVYTGLGVKMMCATEYAEERTSGCVYCIVECLSLFHLLCRCISPLVIPISLKETAPSVYEHNSSHITYQVY